MKFLKHVLSTMIMFIGCGALGDQDRTTVLVTDRSFQVNAGSEVSVALPKKYFLHQLFIFAESANSRDSFGEVSVNGDVKGSLYLPGHDPRYVVTVADAAETIEFVGLENVMKIQKIEALVSEIDTTPEPLPGEYHSQMGRYSARILKMVDHLSGYTDYYDFGVYLLPIRKHAARALAVAEAHGDASAGARSYYLALLSVLDNSQPYFDKMLEIANVYEAIIEIMTQRENIRGLLD